MNSEHLQDLRSRGQQAASEANGAQDEFQAASDAVQWGIVRKLDLYHRERWQVDEFQTVLSDAWAVGMLLAAYDHELFTMHRPGTEAVWNATLCTLLDARSRVLAEAIPLRLREYRERVGRAA